MATDPIDITLQDKVDGSLVTKFKNIGDAATTSGKAVDNLQSSLNGLDPKAIDSLSLSSARLTNAQAALERAQASAAKAGADASLTAAKQQIALQQLAAAAGQAQLAQQRLSTEQARTDAAQVRAAASAMALAKAQAAANSAAAGSSASASAAEKFLAGLQSQVDAIGKTKTELTAMKAAQLGVSDQASPLISALKAAEGATTSFGHSNTGAYREMAVLLHEMSQGNFNRFGGSMLVMASRMNLLGLLFNPVTLGVVALAAGFVLLEKNAMDAEQVLATFQNTLTATGNSVGLTGDQLVEMAQSIHSSTGESFKGAAADLNAYAMTGKLTGDEIGKLGGVTQKWADLTGQKTADVRKSFEQMATDPAASADVWQSQFHKLSAAQAEQIETLVQHGDKLTATRILIDDVTAAIGSQTDKETGWTSFWRNVSNGIADATSNLSKYLGMQKATPNEEISSLNSQISSEQSRLAQPGNDTGPYSEIYLNSLIKQRDALVAVQKASQDAATAQARLNATQDAGKTAHDALVKTLDSVKNSTQLANEAVADFEANIRKSLAANANDATALQALANKTQIEADIRKRMNADEVNDATRRAQAMAEVNLKLNDQANLYGLVGDQLKVQQQLNQIEQQLQAKKITLNGQEEASIRSKIAANIEMQRVQQAMESVYNSTQGAALDAQAKATAIDRLTVGFDQSTLTPLQNIATPQIAAENDNTAAVRDNTAALKGGTSSAAGGSFDSFVKALVQVESGGRTGVTSSQAVNGVHAYGLMQLQPSTAEAMAKQIGVAWQPSLMSGTSSDAAAYQMKLGTAYAQQAWNKASGDPYKAAELYESGLGATHFGPNAQNEGSKVVALMGQQASGQAAANPASPSSPAAAAQQASAPLFTPLENVNMNMASRSESAKNSDTVFPQIQALQQENDLLGQLGPKQQEMQQLLAADSAQRQLNGKSIFDANGKLTLEGQILDRSIQQHEQLAQVSQIANKLYQDTAGAVTTYNATLVANQKILDAGLISQERKNQLDRDAKTALDLANAAALGGAEGGKQAAQIEATAEASDKYNLSLQARKALLEADEVAQAKDAAAMQAAADKYGTASNQYRQAWAQATIDATKNSDNAFDGIKMGAAQFVQSFGSVAQQTASIVTNAISGFSDAIAQFVTTGKLNFGDLARSIIADIVKMIVQMELMKLIMHLIPGLSGGGIVPNSPMSMISLSNNTGAFSSPDLSSDFNLPEGLATGGMIRGYASGGLIPGFADGSTVQPTGMIAQFAESVKSSAANQTPGDKAGLTGWARGIYNKASAQGAPSAVLEGLANGQPYSASMNSAQANSVSILTNAGYSPTSNTFMNAIMAGMIADGSLHSKTGSSGGASAVSVSHDVLTPSASIINGSIRGPGGGREDKILARLSNGEFVVNAQSTRKYGALLKAINDNTFANGGRVHAYADGGVVSGYGNGPMAAGTSSSTVTNYNGGPSITISVDARGAASPDEIDRRVQMGIAQATPALLNAARVTGNHDTKKTLTRPGMNRSR